VQHLLGKAPDAVDRFGGVLVGGHGGEIFLGVGFCPFPVINELGFDLFTADGLGGAGGGSGGEKEKESNRFGEHFFLVFVLTDL
jgi:hypothetical protein